MSDAEPRSIPGFVVWLVISACVVVIVAGLRFANLLVAPLFLAFMLAVILAPVVRRLERFGLPTWLAIVAVLAIAIALLVGFLFLVSVQLSELSQKLPEYQALMTARLDEAGKALEPIQPNQNELAVTASKTSEALIQTVAGALSSLLSGVVIVVFFLFLLCLLLASGRSFSRTLQRVIAPGSDFHRRLAEYLRQVQIQGRIRSASNLLSAAALTGLFILFRIDFAFLWGLLAFVLGYIPNIGLILATVPAVILAFIQYGLGTAVVVLTLAIILNAAVDNFVIPRFISRTSQLPIVIVFLSFIFWGWMFGLLGAIIATQATLLIRALLNSVPETRALAQLMTVESRTTASEGPT
jgi:predicted PurR-regulated permease PerM